MTSKSDYPWSIPGSPFARFWTSPEVKFLVFNGKSAGRKINIEFFFFDIHIRMLSGFDPANKKTSVIYASELLLIYPVDFVDP